MVRHSPLILAQACLLLPKVPQQSCPKHPAILLSRGEYCPKCPKHGWDHRLSRHERGYGTWWDKKRLFILARDDRLCQVCLGKGRTTPAQEVDHITPKAKGGTDEDDNLQSICVSCHREKTTRENGGNPKVSYNKSGEPNDPDHPWNQ